MMKMIETARADEILESHRPDYGSRTVPLDESIGRILAEDIHADRPGPPFNRAAMDGIAVHLEAEASLRPEYRIIDVLPAGGDPETVKKPREAEDALEIMTGAALPREYNAVIPYEHLSISDDRAVFTDYQSSRRKITPLSNIHKRGEDFDTGQRLLRRGTRIAAPQIGILAACGYARVPTVRIPPILLVSTGDELVDADRVPKAHQIRQSNRYSLYAELLLAGLKHTRHIHLPDSSEVIHREIDSALADYRVIVFSGAVSKGKFDFIPSLLPEMGMRIHFHGVKQKPGKPFLFASGRNDERIVMGLPGNPVSSLVCLRRYVIPFLIPGSGPSMHFLPAGKLAWRGEGTFFPAVKKVRDASGAAALEPAAGRGSGDFFQLAESDGFIEIGPGGRPEGGLVPFYPWH